MSTIIPLALSTFKPALTLPRGCAHERAFLQRAHVHVRAYYHRGNTFRFTSVFSAIILLLINPI